MAAFPNPAPLGDDEWPDEIADMKGGFAGALGVYRTMAHHPALLRAWTDLREHIVNATALGPELSEVVILRSGVNLGSDYEFGQHILRARARGLSDARIAALRGPVEEMTGPDATLAHAVDELFWASKLDPEDAAAVVELVGKAGLFDLMATVGFYSTLGFILNTFEVPQDADAAAELAATPLKE